MLEELKVKLRKDAAMLLVHENTLYLFMFRH
jgi:hypothetical protein